MRFSWERNFSINIIWSDSHSNIYHNAFDSIIHKRVLDLNYQQMLLNGRTNLCAPSNLFVFVFPSLEKIVYWTRTSHRFSFRSWFSSNALRQRASTGTVDENKKQNWNIRKSQIAWKRNRKHKKMRNGIKRADKWLLHLTIKQKVLFASQLK